MTQTFSSFWHLLHSSVVPICSTVSINKAWLAVVSSKKSKKEQKNLLLPESTDIHGTHLYSVERKLGLLGLNPQRSFSIYDKILFVSLIHWSKGLGFFVLLPKIQLTQSKYLVAIKRNRFRSTLYPWRHRTYLSFRLEASYSWGFCSVFCLVIYPLIPHFPFGSSLHWINIQNLLPSELARLLQMISFEWDRLKPKWVIKKSIKSLTHKSSIFLCNVPMNG